MSSQLAPTGTLRVGIWTVPFFALARDGMLSGLIPDLGNELARRAGVSAELSGFSNPADLIRAFRTGALDVTFVGITTDRAEVIDFGPIVVELQTTFLVPAASAIVSVADVDRPGMRIAVPAHSAQEAHLKRTLVNATLLPVPAERPQAGLDLVASGAADAFSHVAPMLLAAQRGLPDARILPGSYFNVPIAIGVARGRAAAVAGFVDAFVKDAKVSGLIERAITRAGVTGVVVAR